MMETILLPGFARIASEVGGRTVRAYVAGDGPPLVLVHGLGGAGVNWARLAPLLAGRHRVVVVDLPGHGGSDRLAPGPRELARFADAVADAVAQLGVQRAGYVGHSLGGAIALRLALARPAAVSSLVLVAPAGISSATRRARVGLRVARLLRLGSLAGANREAILARPRLRALAFRGLVGDPECVDPLVARAFLEGAALATDRETAMAAMFAERARESLDRLAVPALVLWGSRDWFLPLDDGFEWARRLRAPLRVVPGAGHLVIGEAPEACAALIEAFLEGLSAPGQG